MRTMSWEEIDHHWSGMQKRHRMEIAEAVAEYCVGHKMEEVARRLGYSRQWVITQLDYAGIGAALGLGVDISTPKLTGSTDNVAKEVSAVIDRFAPQVSIGLSGGGKDHGGDQSVGSVTGKDSEAFEPYLDHYLEQGHEPAAAIRLAKAEWAAESAVEAGVIKEDTNKRKEKVHRILFADERPSDEQLAFEGHMAQVRCAAAFLENAKVAFLKKESTRKAVASAHAKWSAQAEHVRDLHQSSMR